MSGLLYVGVGGVTVSMVAFQAVDPGSTPGRRTLFIFVGVFFKQFMGNIDISTFVRSAILNRP